MGQLTYRFVDQLLKGLRVCERSARELVRIPYMDALGMQGDKFRF